MLQKNTIHCFVYALPAWAPSTLNILQQLFLQQFFVVCSRVDLQEFKKCATHRHDFRNKWLPQESNKISEFVTMQIKINLNERRVGVLFPPDMCVGNLMIVTACCLSNSNAQLAIQIVQPTCAPVFAVCKIYQRPKDWKLRGSKPQHVEMSIASRRILPPST